MGRVSRVSRVGWVAPTGWEQSAHDGYLNTASFLPPSA
jgi:hypothetical protein